MVSGRLEKPNCTPSCHSQVFPMFPLKQLHCSSDWRWPSLVLSRKIIKCFPFPRLSPPGDWWRDVLIFVPAGSVSSSSTLEIFCYTNHLRWLHGPPVYLLGHFPSLRHIQAPQHLRSSVTQTIWDGCMAHQSICLVVSLHSGMSRAAHPQRFSKVDAKHRHTSLGFPFHFLYQLTHWIGEDDGMRWCTHHSEQNKRQHHKKSIHQ